MGSTVLLASALTDGKVYSVDIRLYPKVKDNIEFYKNKIELISGDSENVEWSIPIGLLFIDGDHTKDGVIRDINKYASFVKKDGFIIFHDAIGSKYGIKNAVNKLLLKKGWRKEASTDSMLVICRK